MWMCLWCNSFIPLHKPGFCQAEWVKCSVECVVRARAAQSQLWQDTKFEKKKKNYTICPHKTLSLTFKRPRASPNNVFVLCLMKQPIQSTATVRDENDDVKKTLLWQECFHQHWILLFATVSLLTQMLILTEVLCEVNAVQNLRRSEIR